MSPIFLTLLLFLSSAPLYVVAADHIVLPVDLGPPQVCRCYPVGTAGVSPSGETEFCPKATSGAKKCTKTVSVEISFVADDGVSLYICGIKVRQSSNFDEKQSFRYEGHCDDFMLEIVNDRLGAGVAVLASVNGQKYGTTDKSGHYGVEGTIPMYAIATAKPQGKWYQNPSDYDFSRWTPAVVVQTILGIGENFNSLAREGAYPINVESGSVPPGIYGLKLDAPWC